MIRDVKTRGMLIAINILSSDVGVENLTSIIVKEPCKYKTFKNPHVIPFSIKGGCGTKLLHALDIMEDQVNLLFHQHVRAILTDSIHKFLTNIIPL